MIPKVTVYVFLPSQNAVRPQIALREKGVEFERVSLNLLAGEHKRPPLSEITPRSQVPTLVYGEGDDAVVVYESIATIRFIDDMFPEPPLLPPISDAARRAEALMRIEEFQAKLDGKNIFGSAIFRRQTREELGPRVDDLLKELRQWEHYLEGRSYLAGEQFTLADIAVFPLLIHFEILGYDYAKRAPALHAYIERCKARPSVQETDWLPALQHLVDERGPNPVLADPK